jgi:nucleoside-diphosphate-sugar epimerase
LILTKIHSTGGTGYIGGSVLQGIVEKFPSLNITALIRSQTAEFETRFPNVKAAIGDFDSFNVIEQAAEEADVVVRTLSLITPIVCCT